MVAPDFGDKLRTVRVQLRDLALLDDECLVGLPDFQAQISVPS
ncbi:hypothetical protein [Ralstonia solanacearum]|nr:hypothetical protein [Ralstonia solanacearum]